MFKSITVCFSKIWLTWCWWFKIAMLRNRLSSISCWFCVHRPTYVDIANPNSINKVVSVYMSSYIKRPPRPRSPLSVIPPPSFESDEMQFDWRTKVVNQFIYGVHPCLLALTHRSRYVHRAFVRKDYFQTKRTNVQNPSLVLIFTFLCIFG